MGEICIDYKVEGVTSIDIPKKTWSEVEKDCQTRQINTMDVLNAVNGVNKLKISNNMVTQVVLDKGHLNGCCSL